MIGGAKKRRPAEAESLRYRCGSGRAETQGAEPVNAAAQACAGFNDIIPQYHIKSKEFSVNSGFSGEKQAERNGLIRTDLDGLFTRRKIFGILILCKFAPCPARQTLKIECYEKDRGI